MKKTMALLLAIMLALPMMACGEGSDVLVDAFIERTGIEASELGSLLLMMELDGLIEALPGCMYRLA